MKKYQHTIKTIFNKRSKIHIAIIGLVWGVAIPYFQIKKDIALIKQNHMTHIETIQGNIERNYKRMMLRLQSQYIGIIKGV